MKVGVRLLVIDPEVCEETLLGLTGEGFTVHHAACGADGLVELGFFTPDAVLLGPQLGDLSLADAVRAIRRRSTLPVLLGLGDEPDLGAIGEALLMGATGTLSRPYDPHEVAVKVVTTLPASSARAPLSLGPLWMDPLAYRAQLDGKELPRMGLKEFQLLQYLMQQSDCVVSAADLRRVLSADGQPLLSRNAIAVYVRRVRARLHPPLNLETIRGVGYRLTLEG